MRASTSKCQNIYLLIPKTSIFSPTNKSHLFLSPMPHSWKCYLSKQGKYKRQFWHNIEMRGTMKWGEQWKDENEGKWGEMMKNSPINEGNLSQHLRNQLLLLLLRQIGLQPRIAIIFLHFFAVLSEKPATQSSFLLIINGLHKITIISSILINCIVDGGHFCHHYACKLHWRDPIMH